ncbi:tetratricopeptide repeat protein [Devosia sp.]|uniref:tetratricopeptide repeat protein n=1 Tax=Devosia sp. TaxID=1871048 RepID=UPI003BA88F68
MSRRSQILTPLRGLLLVGVAALALSGCAMNPTTTGSIGTPPDFTAQTPDQRQIALQQLAAHYKKNPGDRATIIYYSAALRANGQNEQAVAVLEAGISKFKNDMAIEIAYAKALASAGRFEQALNIIETAIDPTNPDWNALLVKGAILDQSGKNVDARDVYATALKIAPDQPSLHANLGLSFAMTNNLDQAESELRLAVKLRGATSQVRQNLALVVGLQGRFDEARAMFAAELPPAQVEANMSYIRALLTQQNRWDLIKGAKGQG